MDYFKGKQFQKDVIIVAVGYYLRFWCKINKIVFVIHWDDCWTDHCTNNSISDCDDEKPKRLGSLWLTLCSWCMTSIPLSVFSAVRSDWKPLDFTKTCLINRWSCSIKLLRYLEHWWFAFANKPSLITCLIAFKVPAYWSVTRQSGRP